jgi:hypothetical protein
VPIRHDVSPLYERHLRLLDYAIIFAIVTIFAYAAAGDAMHYAIISPRASIRRHATTPAPFEGLLIFDER